MIALQQCVTFSRVKIKKKTKKNGSKLGPKLDFLPFSQVGFISFPLIGYNDSLQQCTASSKTHGKNLGGPNLCQNWVGN